MHAWLVNLKLWLAAAGALAAVPALAIDDYGSGWAYVPLDMSSTVTREILKDNVMRARAGIGTSGRDSGVSNVDRPMSASPFAAAVSPVDGVLAPVAAVQTDFVRSKTLQQRSEAGILAEIKKRQPNALAEYEPVLGQQDMAKLFDKAVRGYGLRNNDIADTMAAYWLVSWVIVNDAKVFSPAAARAVRDQLKGGIARTPVAGFSPEKKHRLADEAIFNTLIATQALEYVQGGKISEADYRRIGDVTRQAFLGFGADLRQLQLTDAGFVKR